MYKKIYTMQDTRKKEDFTPEELALISEASRDFNESGGVNWKDIHKMRQKGRYFGNSSQRRCI